MGKVFQVLNRGESVHRPTPAGPRLLENGSAAPPPEPEEPHEDVPFIEVGPRKSVDASPDVLATAPPTSKGPRSAAADQAIVPVTAPAAEAESSSPRLQGPHRAPELFVFHKPDDPAGERYRHVLARLTSARAEAAARLLLVGPAAATSAELAATVLLNLAVTAACRDGRPVVVVDADFRQPRVARALGLPEHPGLGEVLAGECALEQALQRSGQANLLALTAGRDERPGGARFVAETVRSVLRQLRQCYDLVFVRGPAWDSSPDARHLAEACDAVYSVLPESEAATARIDELLQAVSRRGAKRTGCIVTS